MLLSDLNIEKKSYSKRFGLVLCPCPPFFFVVLAFYFSVVCSINYFSEVLRGLNVKKHGFGTK